MDDTEYKEWLHIFELYGFGDPHGEVGKGWWSLIAKLLNDLSSMGFSKENLRIIQVKEKLAGLRFYTNVISGKLTGEQAALVAGRIREAEYQSYVTCEVCGEPGVMRAGGWYKTLCDEHANGREPTSLIEQTVQL